MMPSAIEKLVQSKDFEDLSSEERQLVQSLYSEEAYRAERAVYLASQTFFELEAAQLDLVPTPPSAKIQAALAKRQATTKPAVLPLWKRSVQVWKVAAACLLCWFLGVAWQASDSKNLGQGLVEAVRDTIVVKEYITKVEEVLQVPDTIIRTIYKIKEVPVPANTAPSTDPKLLAMDTTVQDPTETKSRFASQTRVDRFSNLMQYMTKGQPNKVAADSFGKLEDRAFATFGL